ncbi:MAG TPA: tRNA pseudouridine(55) synthase TruB [Anaerolineae bacterium]|nr:tRNA pseudouridine(55) synthase TruB [Anaerolineae bacterium]
MADCPNCPKAQSASKARWIAPRREVLLSGILNIDKPPGMTSHDVVDAVRRVAGQRKVGHAGTLDPMATGVLLVCLGQATRVAEYLMAGRKCYQATIALGMATDTYDADGQISSSGGRTDFGQNEIEAALDRFVGRIQQVPPMYSALKQNGQPLYKLARQGRAVERAPRQVEIFAVELLDWTPPSLIVEVTCSAGTYIRSLAHDLGQWLGSGAYLAALVRLSSGRFSLEEAVSLGRLEEAFQHAQEDRYLLPLDEAFLEWPAILVGSDDARRIAHGHPIPGDPPPNDHDRVVLHRAYSMDGDFLAVMAFHADSGQWRPKKVFAS